MSLKSSGVTQEMMSIKPLDCEGMANTPSEGFTDARRLAARRLAERWPDELQGSHDGVASSKTARKLQDNYDGGITIGYGITISEWYANTSNISVGAIAATIGDSDVDLTRAIATSATKVMANNGYSFQVSTLSLSAPIMAVVPSDWRDRTTTTTTTSTWINITAYTRGITGRLFVLFNTTNALDSRTMQQRAAELQGSVQVQRIISEAVSSSLMDLQSPGQVVVNQAAVTIRAGSRRLAAVDRLELSVDIAIHLLGATQAVAYRIQDLLQDDVTLGEILSNMEADWRWSSIVANVTLVPARVQLTAVDLTDELMRELSITTTTTLAELTLMTGEGVSAASMGWVSILKLGRGEWYREWSGVLFFCWIAVHIMVSFLVWWFRRHMAVKKKRNLIELEKNYRVWKPTLTPFPSFAPREGASMGERFALLLRRQVLTRCIGVTVGVDDFMALPLKEALCSALVARYLQLLVAIEVDLHEVDVGFLMKHLSRSSDTRASRFAFESAKDTAEQKKKIAEAIVKVDNTCIKLAKAHDIRMKLLVTEGWSIRPREFWDVLKAEHPVWRLFMHSISVTNSVRVMSFWLLDFAGLAAFSIFLRITFAYDPPPRFLEAGSVARDIFFCWLARWLMVVLAALRDTGLRGQPKSSEKDGKEPQKDKDSAEALAWAEGSSTVVALGSIVCLVCLIICACFLSDWGENFATTQHWIVGAVGQVVTYWLLVPLLRALLWCFLPLVAKRLCVKQAVLRRMAAVKDEKRSLDASAIKDRHSAFKLASTVPSGPPLPPPVPPFRRTEHPPSLRPTPRFPDLPQLPDVAPLPPPRAFAHPEADDDEDDDDYAGWPAASDSDSDEGGAPVPSPREAERMDAQAVFGELDVNGDGVLTATEIERGIRLGLLRLSAENAAARVAPGVPPEVESRLRAGRLPPAPAPPPSRDVFVDEEDELQQADGSTAAAPPRPWSAMDASVLPGALATSGDDDSDSEISAPDISSAPTLGVKPRRREKRRRGAAASPLALATAGTDTGRMAVGTLQNENTSLRDRNKQLQELVAEAGRLRDEVARLPPTAPHTERERLRQARREIRQRATTLGAALAAAAEKRRGRPAEVAADTRTPRFGEPAAAAAAEIPRPNRPSPAAEAQAIVESLGGAAGGSVTLSSLQRAVRKGILTLPRRHRAKKHASAGSNAITLAQDALSTAEVQEIKKESKKLQSHNKDLIHLVSEARDLSRRLASSTTREERRELKTAQARLREDLRELKQHLAGGQLGSLPEEGANEAADSVASSAAAAEPPAPATPAIDEVQLSNSSADDSSAVSDREIVRTTRRANKSLRTHNKSLRDLVNEARDVSRKLADKTTTHEERRELRAARRTIAQRAEQMRSAISSSPAPEVQNLADFFAAPAIAAPDAALASPGHAADAYSSSSSSSASSSAATVPSQSRGSFGIPKFSQTFEAILEDDEEDGGSHLASSKSTQRRRPESQEAGEAPPLSRRRMVVAPLGPTPPSPPPLPRPVRRDGSAASGGTGHSSGDEALSGREQDADASW